MTAQFVSDARNSLCLDGRGIGSRSWKWGSIKLVLAVVGTIAGELVRREDVVQLSVYS